VVVSKHSTAAAGVTTTNVERRTTATDERTNDGRANEQQNTKHKTQNTKHKTKNNKQQTTNNKQQNDKTTAHSSLPALLATPKLHIRGQKRQKLKVWVTYVCTVQYTIICKWLAE